MKGVVERTKHRIAPRVETLAVEGGGTLTATPNHPFFSSRAKTWIALGSLAPDDSVMVLSGDALVPRAMTTAPRENAEGAYVVYDISVSPWHDYFAGGVLVHNY